MDGYDTAPQGSADASGAGGFLKSFRWRAIAVGVAVDIAATVMFWGLYANAFLTEEIDKYGGIDRIPEESLSQVDLVALGLIGTLGTVVGGYMAGRIAVHEETRHGVAVAVVSLVLGLGLELALEGAIRLKWWELPFLALAIPAGAFGGYVAQRLRAPWRSLPER